MRAEATSFLSRATVLAAVVGFAARQPVASAAGRVLHSNQDASIAHTNQDNVIPGLLGISDDTAPAHAGLVGMVGTLVADWYVQSAAVPVDTAAHGAQRGALLVRLDERVERAAASPRRSGSPVPAPGVLPLLVLLPALGPRRRRRR